MTVEKTYVELANEVQELQKQLQELQQTYATVNSAKGDRAQMKESFEVSEELADGAEVCLTIDNDSLEKAIIHVCTSKVNDEHVNLTVEQFNQINNFLSKYNEAIFLYMQSLKDLESNEAVE